MLPNCPLGFLLPGPKDPGLWVLHSPSVIIIQDLPCSHPPLFEELTFLHPHTHPLPLNKRVLQKQGFHITFILILEQLIHLVYVMQSQQSRHKRYKRI